MSRTHDGTPTIERRIEDAKEEFLANLPAKTSKAVRDGKVKFDYDRLAQEVDMEVDMKLKLIENFIKKAGGDSLKELQSLSESLEMDLDHTFDALRKDHTNTFNQHFRKLLEDTREELLAELAKGRTQIHLTTDSRVLSINVDNSDHPKTEDVIESLAIFGKSMLVGPAGTGKTYLVEKIANGLKVVFYKYSCSRDSSVHDLLGYKQPRSEEYLETTFIKAYENGGLFLVDEYDAMSGDMSLFFNGVADGSSFISIPHRDEKPTATRHKDFYLVMCGNTWGKGSVEFSGRDFQDSALMDRFRACRHMIGYNEALEKQFLGNNYIWGMKLRKDLENTGSYLSTRNIEDMMKLLNAGKGKYYVTEMVCEDLEPEEREPILRNAEKEEAKEVAAAYNSSLNYKENAYTLENSVKELRDSVKSSYSSRV